MKGGNLSSLKTQGFSDSQIETLQDMNISYDEINAKIQQLIGDDFHGNSDDVAEQTIIELSNEHNINNNLIQDNSQSQVDDDSLHLSDLDNSLHLSDLDNSQSQNSGYTTDEDMSFGGSHKRMKTHRKKTKPHRKKTKTHRKKTKTHRKKTKTHRKKTKTHRKKTNLKGGTLFGKGVGANNFDPNFSIYNTRELGLFPYKNL
jgi:hypothetical protein